MNIEKIRVDTEQLKKDRESVKANLEMIKKEIKSIYGEVKELDAMWDGSANEAFKKQFNNDYTTINEILSEISKFIGKMDYARYKYESCEQSISEMIRKIRV